VWASLPGTRRLRDRCHDELAEAAVFAPTARMLAFEVGQRLRRSRGWDAIIARNTLYQKHLVAHLAAVAESFDGGDPPTLFSYSGAALELFRFAKARGWRTVLGQIDPGPEEERIVEANSPSRGVNPSIESTTNKIASELSMAMKAPSRVLSAKSGSGSQPMPPVSVISKGACPSLQTAPMRSRVTPGWSWTMEILRPARRLKRADLPTFGRPMIATWRMVF
jgi:hypothetical protein